MNVETRRNLVRTIASTTGAGLALGALTAFALASYDLVEYSHVRI